MALSARRAANEEACCHRRGGVGVMTKRLALLFAIATLAVLLVPALAFANFGPHGNYVQDTDACAGCHRAHTSVSTITWPTERTTTALCWSPPRPRCTSSATRVTTPPARVPTPTSSRASTRARCTARIEAILNGGGFDSLDLTSTTSTHMYTGSSWGAYGGGYTGAGTTGADGVYDAPDDPFDANLGESVQIKMDCGSCHDPHGSANYRILKAVRQRQLRRWLHADSRRPQQPEPERLRLVERDRLAGDGLPAAHRVPGLHPELHHAAVRQGLRRCHDATGSEPDQPVERA